MLELVPSEDAVVLLVVPAGFVVLVLVGFRVLVLVVVLVLVLLVVVVYPVAAVLEKRKQVSTGTVSYS